MRQVAAFLAALALAATLAACGSGGWHTWHGRGVTVQVPPGWHATSAALTPVTWPVQFLAVASFPLPRNDHGADGCEPAAAIDRLPPDGAFLFGWEYVGAPLPVHSLHKREFPSRPRRFRLSHVGSYECLPHSYLLRFRAAGRYFQVHVAFGPDAGPRTRALALRVLDRLVVQRSYWARSQRPLH